MTEKVEFSSEVSTNSFTNESHTIRVVDKDGNVIFVSIDTIKTTQEGFSRINDKLVELIGNVVILGYVISPEP